MAKVAARSGISQAGRRSSERCTDYGGNRTYGNYYQLCQLLDNGQSCNAYDATFGSP